jgi:hypothetical protein
MSEKEFTTVLRVFKGDTLEPISCLIKYGGQFADLSAYTVTAEMRENVSTTSTDPEAFDYDPDYSGTPVFTAKACTVQPSSNVTFDTARDVVVKERHGLYRGCKVKFSTSGTLPTPLVTTRSYTVVNATEDEYQIAYAESGLAIDLGGSPSGTHSMIAYGHVTVPLVSADVDTAMVAGLRFEISDGTDSDSASWGEIGQPIVIYDWAS